LTDGDLIELGHTFFIFREALSTTERNPTALDSGELQPTAAALATLVPKLAEQFARLETIAPSPVSVVIQGESGTGKELVAQAIHKLSRRPGALVAVNCAALPQTLVESELFGYRKGAFSGATEDRTGLIRSADQGTLFLDEIGDLPTSAQAVFLRVLQESEVVPLGATRPVKVDIRVLAATHRDLEALVGENHFRADLLARIAGFTLSLPGLRERREDLGLLLGTLLKRHFSNRAEGVSFSSDAARALLLYDWPLNVRELEKCLTAAVVLAQFGTVEETHLPGPVRAFAQGPKQKTGDAPAQLSESDQRHREEIIALLREHGGNITSVARALGKGRFQIQRWIKRYCIDAKEFRR
jgi:sigma-54 dependent transcriptional regulator, acetoin dehydrogenase operon transcriptional activator AcoR